jgi:hypothetical protein
MLVYLMYGKRKLHFPFYLYLTLWLFTAFSGHLDGRRLRRLRLHNGPFISLKNGSFKEPLLSLHFLPGPWA